MANELNPISIYSAVVATGVAIWQVYTYVRDGPRLKATAGSNRRIVDGGGLDSKTYIVVNVVNVGNRATTIQVFGLYVYENWWKRFRRKSSTALVIIPATSGNTVPHVLEPGHTFMGLATQTDEIVKLSREKLTYLLVAHSMGKREVLVRLRPIDDVKGLRDEK